MTARLLVSRLFLPFAATIVLIVGVCGTSIYFASEHAARAQQIDELARLSNLVREQLPDEQSPTVLQAKQLRSLASALATRITLIDARGKILFETDANADAMDNHNQRPEIVAARASGVGSSVRFSHTLNEDAVYVAQPLDPNHRDGTILRLSYPRHAWTRLAVAPWIILLAATLSSALLLTWITLLLYRNWVRPVESLSLATAKLAAGEWNTRVLLTGSEELRDLSRRLNHTAEQAQRQLDDLETRQSELRALVDSLPDPILLIDERGRIVLINRPAAKVVQREPAAVLGRLYTDVLNDPKLLGLFESVDRPRESNGDADLISHDIMLARPGQKLYFQAIVSRTRGGGRLLVLRNVTTMASAIQMKADFVANASHELRTPITAIKIAFETLEEVHREDFEQSERCIRIISAHLQRLEEMLTDLLDLSRAENAELKPQLAPVRVDDLFAAAQTILTTAARGKEIELELRRDPRVPEAFESDKALLDLILRNLIENSAKFTRGGGRVTVELKRGDDDTLDLIVQDTGVGIPAEHLERVFERFYQVDAARASAAGRGTGLGLAIVKHAAHALRGTVKLASTVNVGTIVTCTIPLRAVAENVGDVAASLVSTPG